MDVITKKKIDQDCVSVVISSKGGGSLCCKEFSGFEVLALSQ
jgi:hypothetical protein